MGYNIYLKEKIKMDCKCQERVKIRNVEEKKKLLNRLKRIEGQVRGIHGMVERDCYCGDIIMQLSAVSSAVKSLANLMMDDHMHTCIVEQVKNNDFSGLDEVVDLFKRFQ